MGHKKIDRPIYGPPEARACLEGLTIREDVELWLLPYRAAMTLTAHAEGARRLAELPASVQSAEVDLERLQPRAGPPTRNGIRREVRHADAVRDHRREAL